MALQLSLEHPDRRGPARIGREDALRGKEPNPPALYTRNERIDYHKGYIRAGLELREQQRSA